MLTLRRPGHPLLKWSAVSTPSSSCCVNPASNGEDLASFGRDPTPPVGRGQRTVLQLQCGFGLHSSGSDLHGAICAPDGPPLAWWLHEAVDGGSGLVVAVFRWDPYWLAPTSLIQFIAVVKVMTTATIYQVFIFSFGITTVGRSAWRYNIVPSTSIRYA